MTLRFHRSPATAAQWIGWSTSIGTLLIGALVLSGWLRLHDSASGIALVAVTYMVMLTGVVWWSAHAIVRLDAQRQMLAATLRKREARLQRLIDTNVIGVAVAGPNGEVFEANAYYLSLLGFSREEFEAGDVRWNELTPPEYLPADQRALDELQRTGMCSPYEKEYIRKDGARVWVLITDAVLPEEDGKILALIQNITDRKLADGALHTLNTTLEQHVQERTVQLEAAVKELEAFSYSISHDLRAPLRALDGFSRILLSEYAAQLPEEARGYLARVRANAGQMGQLIDDLLAFSRLSRQPFQRVPLCPDELVRQVVQEFQQAGEARAEVVTIEPLPLCTGDAALLRQVFVNLLSNALKFTAHQPAPRITVGCLAGSSRVYFVRDNGAGFDMRYADKLFGVFQRLHRMEDYPGTGVGLAIVQRIIHRHGGRVWAEAAPEQGATFYFTLEEGDAHGND